MLKLTAVFGTRPEIIKLAPVILEAKRRNINLTIIHTGQHYDEEMSGLIIQNLGIPKPDINLTTNTSDSDIQLGEMISQLGSILRKNKPDMVIAAGDTNSVLACSLACSVNNIPFGHIEAGLRSFDNTMPEERNRKLVDGVSSFLFAPSKRAVINLLHEKIDSDRIFLTGNTIVDAVKIFSKNLKDYDSHYINQIREKIKVDYILCTIHRISNVEIPENLVEIIKAFESINSIDIVFFTHPRTLKKIQEINCYKRLVSIPNLSVFSSVDYLSILKILSDHKCKLILTDSGGLQEEALILKKPCVTIRPNTERPETVENGVNFLVPAKGEIISETVKQTLADVEIQQIFEKIENPYGEGDSSLKILDIIEQNWQNAAFNQTLTYTKGAYSYSLISIQENIDKEEFEKRYKCKICVIYNNRGDPLDITEKLLEKSTAIVKIIE